MIINDRGRVLRIRIAVADARNSEDGIVVPLSRGENCLKFPGIVGDARDGLNLKVAQPGREVLRDIVKYVVLHKTTEA